MGGLPAFKQQNEAHGLPVKLKPEEAALALARGWLAPYLAPPLPATPVPAADSPPPPPPPAAAEPAATTC